MASDSQLSDLAKPPSHYNIPHADEVAERNQRQVVEAQQHTPENITATHHFHIHWADPSGKIWDGDFVCKVPTVGQEISVGRMKADLIGQSSLERIDQEAQDIAHMVAYLQFSLTKRPAWMANILEIQHLELLRLVYVEVAKHVAAFRLGQRSPGKGEETP